MSKNFIPRNLPRSAEPWCWQTRILHVTGSYQNWLFSHKSNIRCHKMVKLLLLLPSPLIHHILGWYTILYSHISIIPHVMVLLITSHSTRYRTVSLVIILSHIYHPTHQGTSPYLSYYTSLDGVTTDITWMILTPGPRLGPKKGREQDNDF